MGRVVHTCRPGPGLTCASLMGKLTRWASLSRTPPFSAPPLLSAPPSPSRPLLLIPHSITRPSSQWTPSQTRLLVAVEAMGTPVFVFVHLAWHESSAVCKASLS